MEIYPCKCSWDIPGVESLPNHTHHYVTTWALKSTGEHKIVSAHPRMVWMEDSEGEVVEMEESLTIWIPWERLCRALMAL